MAMNPRSLETLQTEMDEGLLADEAGIGTLGIILIVVLLLILFGVIGFSFNA